MMLGSPWNQKFLMLTSMFQIQALNTAHQSSSSLLTAASKTDEEETEREGSATVSVDEKTKR